MRFRKFRDSSLMRTVRLAIITTHPIQYHIPWYQALSGTPDVEVKVFYGVIPDPVLQGSGFDIPFTWDIPMFEGYHSWVSVRSNEKLLKGGVFFLVTRDLESALTKWRPDVALVTGWNSLFLFQAVWICRKHHIPIIVRGEVNGLKPRSRLIHRYHDYLFKRFDAFLAIGKQNHKYYLEHQVPSGSIYDAPYFIDNARFAHHAAQERQRRSQLRDKFGIGKDEYCLLFVGKIIEKKRIMDLLYSIERYHNDLHTLRVLVVGSGKQMAATREYAERAGLPVSFLGFLNQGQIVQAYAVADLLVLPSDGRETWGLVVNEAMAAGLPALVSDQIGCAADLIIPGKTGYMYRMGNLEALGDKLVLLSRSPRRSSAMGRNAQKHVLDNYSVDRAVLGTLEAVGFATGERHREAHTRER